MAEPADGRAGLRGELERLLLAGFGAVALTGDRVEELADALAARGSVRRDEAREAIESAVSRWRGDAGRLGERAGTSLERVYRELGVVPRRDWEELDLRVAQLEHRLRLLEREAPLPARGAGSAAEATAVRAVSDPDDADVL